MCWLERKLWFMTTWIHVAWKPDSVNSTDACHVQQRTNPCKSVYHNQTSALLLFFDYIWAETGLLTCSRSLTMMNGTALSWLMFATSTMISKHMSGMLNTDMGGQWPLHCGVDQHLNKLFHVHAANVSNDDACKSHQLSKAMWRSKNPFIL